MKVKRILIMGLPGSGKTTLAKALENLFVSIVIFTVWIYFKSEGLLICLLLNKFNVSSNAYRGVLRSWDIIENSLSFILFEKDKNL